MKKWNNVFVLLMVLVILSACASNQHKTGSNVQSNGTGKSGGELIFGTATETPSLDPYLESADERTKRTVLMYEGLTWVNDSMKIEPKLAESWEISPDGKTYTFKLRKNVFFHNGQQMTAEDVKYSYDQLRDKKFGSAGAGDMSSVQEIKIVDENTVQFILSEPFSSLLAVVGGRFGGVVPKGTYDNGDLRNREVGTGPYKLVDWKQKNRMDLQRFDKYWNKDIAFLDKITIRIVPDENSLMAGLRSGQIDMAMLGDPKNYNVLKSDSKLQVERYPALRWGLLDFSNNTPPLNDVRVRQAIAKAIDKNEVMNAATGGIGTVIGTMPSAFGDWVVPPDQLPNQKRDVEGAKKLLAEAGIQSGTKIPLRIIDSLAWMRPAAEVIASNLSEVGITPVIETVDLGVFIKDWNGYKSPHTLNEWGGFMDPGILYYRHFHNQPKGGDWRKWNSDKASEILDKARVTTDNAELHKLYGDLQKLIAEEVPSIPLFSPDNVVVMQKKISGYKHHPSGTWYGLLHVKLTN